MTTKHRKQAQSSSRRKGALNSQVRLKLIEAAQKIVQNEGTAAVTAGRLAKEVGLGRHIVHYYFGTIDELFVEVLRTSAEETRQQLERALVHGNPLRLIWTPSSAGAPLVTEFLALAPRSEIIRAEIGHYMRLFRSILTQALEKYLEERGLRANVPREAIVVAVMSISQALGSEAALGVQDGHREIEELMNGWIEMFEASGEWPTGRPSQLAGKGD